VSVPDRRAEQSRAADCLQRPLCSRFRQQLTRGVMQFKEDGMAGKTERSGSCLCGAVRISIKTTSKSVGACHCGMCRKWTGGPLLVIECGSAVHFEGNDSISVFSSSDWAERGFCSKCGSHLFYRLKKEGHYAVPVGLLDDGEQWVFDQQIFIDEKPSFYSFANQTKNLTGAEVFAQYSAPSE
jgi:hypothetical protein